MTIPVIPKRRTRKERLVSALKVSIPVGMLCSAMCVGLWVYVGMFVGVPYGNIIILAIAMFAVGALMMFPIMYQNTPSVEEYNFRKRMNFARNYFVNKEQVESDLKFLGAAADEIFNERGRDGVKDWMIVERAIDNARAK